MQSTRIVIFESVNIFRTKYFNKQEIHYYYCIRFTTTTITISTATATAHHIPTPKPDSDSDSEMNRETMIILERISQKT